MADNFTLPPDQSDLDLGTVTIDATMRPYVEAWFASEGAVGDTITKFILRAVYQAAMNHRAASIVAAERRASDAAYEAYQQTVATDLGTAVGAAERALP